MMPNSLHVERAATEKVAEKPPAVAKAFNTEYRRFRVGDVCTRDDLKGSKFDYDVMVERGFIVAG